MRSALLDLKVTVKAEEKTLQALRDKLIGQDSDCSSLGDALATIIQQTLVAAGTTDDFEVDFNCGQVNLRYRTGGGLNAQEWIPTGPSPLRPEDIPEEN